MKISIKLKVFLFTLVFNTILTSIIGFIIFDKAKEIFVQRQIDEKIRILNSLSQLIDGDKIKSWKTINDTKTEYYKFIQNLIQNLWKHDDKDTYLYTLRYDKDKDDFFYSVANSYSQEIIWIEFETVAFWISVDQTKNLYIKYFQKDYYDDFEVEFDSKKLPVKFIRSKNETKVFLANTELFLTNTTERVEVKINGKLYGSKLKKRIPEDFIIEGKSYKGVISTTENGESIGLPEDPYYPNQKLKEKLKFILRSKQTYYDSDFRKSIYGYFVSIFVPILDSNKEVSGIIVYDLSNHKIEDFQSKIYLTLINYIIYAIILIFILSILFAFYLTEPIFSMIRVLNKSKSNNFNFNITTKRKDEFRILIHSLNEMSKSIQEKSIIQKNYTEDLEKKVSERTVELKLAKQKAEKSVKIKTDFLRVISHELRTPLNGVLGMASLLKQTELNSEQKEFLHNIDSSAENLLSLINNILEITQIDAVSILNENKKFSIKEEVQNLMNKNSYLFEEKKLSSALVFENEIPEYVLGNLERYKQVFQNLISNSIKFTEMGLIEIKISVQKTNSKQIHLATKIKDTGIGIDEETKENLFKEFSQADSNLNRKYGGSGLGLYISKKVLEILGGELKFESAIHKGSTFEFSFPLEILEESKILIAPKNDLKKLSEEFPLKILVAEDNLVNQLLIKKILKNFGYEIDIANDGVIALQKCREKTYDLIFMDIQMPNMDGISAAELILTESKNKPYIIALTANVLEEDKRKYKEVGFKAHIGKPYPQEAIRNAIIEMKELNPV